MSEILTFEKWGVFRGTFDPYRPPAENTNKPYLPARGVIVPKERPSLRSSRPITHPEAQDATQSLVGKRLREATRWTSS